MKSVKLYTGNGTNMNVWNELSIEWNTITGHAFSSSYEFAYQSVDFVAANLPFFEKGIKDINKLCVFEKQEETLD